MTDKLRNDVIHLTIVALQNAALTGKPSSWDVANEGEDYKITITARPKLKADNEVIEYESNS